MKELIKELTESDGTSGHEESLTELIKTKIEQQVDEVRIDKLGNLIAFKEGASEQTLMLAAHMDEIGLMVTHIDEDGFIRFSRVGGVAPYLLLGARVRFSNGMVGVIGKEKLKSIKELSFDKLYIDVGLSSKEEVSEKISIGDVAVFDRNFVDLGDRLVAKALDDRIGCALLMELINDSVDLANDTYFVFTVQEEVGLRGARTSAFGINPDLALAIDVTRTGDTPESKTRAVSLGEGPAVKIKDRSVIAHPRVKELMLAVAKKEELPYQLEVLKSGGTDAGSIHLTREGVPSGVLSIPARYIHTPSEMVDYGDVENSLRFLKAFVQQEIK
ncbi:M42 family metallopeptidase [Fuchsiella alkaliacetigena]|uniref:M42 family metallopeptidase n=1 Tax=Fuchsiella alkaliacetigena TaxID=957042 RepID=UPI002009FA03|nr:M42 family metallopeptidase [Fuchsiella alkaliacetigena]MCK8823754.1 M42 family metallopeptidase [Fuchsiella alkaliacetigena]